MKIRHSFKGIIQGFYNDYKQLTYVIIGITVGIHGMNLLLELLSSMSGEEVVIKQGVLNVSIAAAYFSAIVMGIVLTTKNAFRSKFAFPISRKEFAIGHALMMAYGSMAIIFITIILGFIDLLLSRIMGGLIPNVMVMTNINWTTYVYGTLTSIFVLMVSIAFVYCIFIYIKRWRLISLVTLGVLLLTFIRGLFNASFIQFIKEAVLLLVVSEHVFITIIKLLVWFVIFNLLAYIPLRKMEVA